MLNVGGGSFGIIIVTALLDIVLLWAYLNAMQRDESSRVIVYYQLVPIFGILAGRAFLGEVISNDQLVAMGIVIFGTTIVSLENVEGRFRFKGRTVGFMLLACACWSDCPISAQAGDRTHRPDTRCDERGCDMHHRTGHLPVARGAMTMLRGYACTQACHRAYLGQISLAEIPGHRHYGFQDIPSCFSLRVFR